MQDLKVKKKDKKGRSIMQRLSNWFEDHLPLRKRDHVKRSEKRKASKSVTAPRMRYTVSNAQKQNDRILDQLPFAGNGPHSMSISMIGKNSIFDDGYTDQRMHQSYYDEMNFSTFSRPSAFPGNLSQSFSAYSSCRAPKIRTNPWIRDRSSFRQSANSAFRSPRASRSIYSAPSALSAAAAKNPQLKPPPSELMFSSMDRTSQLRVKSLDESTCSSGYGSQDSSPESSVHSPDWQQTAQQKKQVEDKAIECRSIDVDEACAEVELHNVMSKTAFDPNYDDEHVYHELESLQRLSLLLEEKACSSEADFASPQPTREFMNSESRNSSPIYAVPYDSQRNSLCSENPFDINQDPVQMENPYARIQPLSIESPFFRKPIPRTNYSVPARRQGYYQPQGAPEWHCPPPPPLERDDNGEVDFLAELDKQIAELQIQSDAVRHLVEQAKERQELRERTRLLCMEHINELRKMRWFMRNNFELCL